jgi:hypothetical protein
MSKVSSFGFTNSTASTNLVTPQELGLASNYALMSDQADVVTLNNKTAPIDQEEIISYRSRVTGNVNSNLNIQYPAPVKSGIEYSIRIDELLSTTDTADPDFRIDEPIVCTIAFRHPRSGNITNAIVAQVMTRAISSLRRADGTWRFDDLMRSAERPVVD